MAVEIMDFTMKNAFFFSIAPLNYQRVKIWTHSEPVISLGFQIDTPKSGPISTQWGRSGLLIMGLVRLLSSQLQNEGWVYRRIWNYHMSCTYLTLSENMSMVKENGKCMFPLRFQNQLWFMTIFVLFWRLESRSQIRNKIPTRWCPIVS